MPSRTRNLRTRFSVLPGLLLGIAALASAGWESVSFGHVHLTDGLAVHHHHVFLGEHEHSEEHEHSGETPDPDHHRHPGEPHPNERDAPKRPARTILLAATALLQPTVARGFVAPPADPSTFQIPLTLPLLVRTLARPAGPRPPPCSIAVSDLLD